MAKYLNWRAITKDCMVAREGNYQFLVERKPKGVFGKYSHNNEILSKQEYKSLPQAKVVLERLYFNHLTKLQNEGRGNSLLVIGKAKWVKKIKPIKEKKIPRGVKKSTRRFFFW